MKPWVDLSQLFPWLPLRPYLVNDEKKVELRDGLKSSGFSIIDISFECESHDVEGDFLLVLGSGLGFGPVPGNSWSAFSSRVDELLKLDGPPVAVMISRSDELVQHGIHKFARCVSNMLSTTENLGYLDWLASRQIEYFFVGNWVDAKSAD